MKALVLSMLLVGTSAFADSPFDGTWVAKLDAGSLDKKPWVIRLNEGIWTSDRNAPPITVKADGTDQPSPGRPVQDTFALKVLGPDSVQGIRKNAGKVVFTRTLTVAADGKSMLDEWTNLYGAAAATGETVYERLAPGPAGAHAVSGSWKAVTERNLSSNGTTATYKAIPDGMSLSLPTGQSYQAKWDGKDYPYLGENLARTVVLTRHGPNSFSETYKEGGKVVEVDTITLSSDRRSLKVVWEAPQTHRHGAYERMKQ